jgi:hypothetical protein
VYASNLVSSLSLTYGTQYPIDIFYCERQPTASTLNMYTTFSLFPDQTAPTITCPSTNVVIGTTAGECGIYATNVNLTPPTTSDNCAVSLASVTSNAPSYYNLGTNIVLSPDFPASAPRKSSSWIPKHQS